MKKQCFFAFFFVSMLLSNVGEIAAIQENPISPIEVNSNANIVELEITEIERKQRRAFYLALEDPKWKEKLGWKPATATTTATNAANTNENEIQTQKAKSQYCYRFLNLIEYDELLENVEKACNS
jgi:hypothetical protein